MGDHQCSVAVGGSKPPPPNKKLEIVLSSHIPNKPPEISLLSISEEEEEEVNIKTLYTRSGGSLQQHLPIISCHGKILTLLDRDRTKLAIWNPDDGVIIPFSQPSREKDQSVHMFGLGFDPSSKDYKVITFVEYESIDAFEFCHFLVEIFSLKTHSWKRIKYPFGIVAAAKYPDSVARAACPVYSINCTCINGVCYWEAQGKLEGLLVIIPFHLATDNFASEFIPGPRDSCRSNFMLAEFRGSLAVIAFETKPFHFALWVWSGSSWSLRESWEIGGFYLPQEGFFENDKLFLHNYNTNELELYDCAKKKVEETWFQG